MLYTALGQGIYMLSAPFLGRLYTPDEFGVFGLFFTIAATASSFVCLLYDMAIPAAPNDGDARRLTVGAAWIALLFCPLLGLAVSLSSWWGVAGLGTLPIWSGALMATLLLVQAGVQIGQAWLIRRQQTLMIGRSNLSLNIGRGIGQVGGGLALSTWWVLAAGEVVGRLIGVAQIVRSIGFPNLRERSRSREVIDSLKRYREFPIVLVPAQGLDALVVMAQVSGLTILFGPAALGQYYLMRRTLDLPVAFVFRSLSDVFYARIAEYARNDPHRIRPFFLRAFLLLLVAGLVAGAPVILFGAQLFRLVYGTGWEVAGALAAIMMPAAILNLAVAPISRVFALTTKPHLRFSLGIVSAIGTATVLSAAYWFSLNLLQVTAGFSAAIVVSYIGYVIAGYHASGHIRADLGAE